MVIKTVILSLFSGGVNLLKWSSGEFKRQAFCHEYNSLPSLSFRYRLVGITSILCTIIGNTVDWDDEFPVCTGMFPFKSTQVVGPQDQQY
jgi:hypothetical protein